MNLPELPLEAWEKTKMTLHLYLQIVGKIKVKMMPQKNHWWHITLFVNHKGITTRDIFCGDVSMEIQFNFIGHRTEISTSNGDFETIELKDGLSVADFYKKLKEILNRLNIKVHILARPYSLPDSNPIQTPFAEMHDYASYDKVYVKRFWDILRWTNEVFEEFSGRFSGKQSQPQLFWHHMDLALTRFSGKRLDVDDNMNNADKEAYSHEMISFGFWAGDENVREAAFYSYAYPTPKGVEKQPLQPDTAIWNTEKESPMALLMYNDLLKSHNPKIDLLAFLNSTYMAGALSAGWDTNKFKSLSVKNDDF